MCESDAIEGNSGAWGLSRLRRSLRCWSCAPLRMRRLAIGAPGYCRDRVIWGWPLPGFWVRGVEGRKVM